MMSTRVFDSMCAFLMQKNGRFAFESKGGIIKRKIKGAKQT